MYKKDNIMSILFWTMIIFAVLSTDQEDTSVYPQQLEVHTVLSFEGLHYHLHIALNIPLVGKNSVYENEYFLQSLQYHKCAWSYHNVMLLMQ